MKTIRLSGIGVFSYTIRFNEHHGILLNKNKILPHTKINKERCDADVLSAASQENQLHVHGYCYKRGPQADCHLVSGFKSYALFDCIDSEDNYNNDR